VIGIRVNGAQRASRNDETVAAVVASLAADPTGCAVALNDEVVPRAQWATRLLADGDRLEVLTAVQGG
jgi:sulfur carrier protein